MDYYDYLYHHGILGQKWGVRRFQNKNGTLTSAGRKRYGKGFMPSQEAQDRIHDRMYDRSLEGRMDKLSKQIPKNPILERIKKNAEYQNTPENNQNEEIHDDYRKAHSSKKIQKMSDSELRNRLNRLQMESQYSRLMNNNQVMSKGSECVDKMLKAGTKIANITTTALTIYNNFEKIQKILKSKMGD